MSACRATSMPRSMTSSEGSIRPLRLSAQASERQRLELQGRVVGLLRGRQHLGGDPLVLVPVVGHAGVVAELVGRDQHGPFVACLGEQVPGPGDELPAGFELAEAPREEASQAELDRGPVGHVTGALEDLLGPAHGPHPDFGVGVGAVVDDPVRGERHAPRAP